MKKLICILAGATLFGACEQKTDVVAPAAASPVPETKPADPSTYGKKPRLTSEAKTDTTTTSAQSPTP